MGQHNIIELNGKQYDAITGALLGESRIKATPEKRQPAAGYHGRVIDGFIRSETAKPAAPTAASVAPKPAPAQHTAKSVDQPLTGKRFDIQRPAARSVQSHKTERSKTLMRHVVTKPKAELKPHIKTTPPTEMIAKPASDLAIPLEKKLSAMQVNPVRLAAAKQIAKSQHVRKFNHAKATHRPTPAIAVRAEPQITPQVFAPTPVPVPVDPETQPAPQSQDIIEAALTHAMSHKEPSPKHIQSRSHRNRRRLVSALAGVAAFVMIGGFVAYLNMPALELRVASIRAGFHAQMPEYQPTGYALAGGIKSSEGKVALTYQSGDSRYTITQVASDWNSQTLLDYYTENKGKPDQTVQSDGRTIYLYDNSAVWVDGGVRYEISGNATLNADNLVSLATSI